jgi:hypothetical protein
MKTMLGLAACACWLGCGAPVPPGTGSLEGYGAFPVRATYAWVVPLQDDPEGRRPHGVGVTIEFFENEVSCDQSYAGEYDGGSAYVHYFATGNVTEGPFHFPQVIYGSPYGGRVNDGYVGSVDGGLSEVSDERLVGTFEAEVSQGDAGGHLTASFSANRCE